ncbi:MAG: hypothetical protein ACOH2D_12095 [Gelidibacter sp.]|uniref:hypothetical protein n=1 Tax=Gelidibacter sp. TaxID=2018083 RepID=UPI003263714A
MKTIILSLCVVLLLSSCKEENKIPENFDYGTIENGVYSNKFFNLELSYNKDWSPKSREQMTEMTEQVREFVNGDNENLKATSKASEVNFAELFAIFKFPKGTVSEFNPSLIINAENLKSLPQIKTPKDYINETKSMLDSGPLNFVYKEKPNSITIGGKEFASMEVFSPDYDITQEFFVAFDNGFAIAMVISYNDDLQKESLHKMIDNLKFN